jgi:hypothetical protein
MQQIEQLMELREYCRTHKWPRLPQWQHWIYSRNPIAISCVKKVGGRYIINLEAFQNHIQNATID